MFRKLPGWLTHTAARESGTIKRECSCWNGKPPTGSGLWTAEVAVARPARTNCFQAWAAPGLVLGWDLGFSVRSGSSKN
uniref:Uncharacterized protein n=1 Tax=Arundo donax TaxID=35708 RepID=A0A0A9BQI6_ARUDO